MSRASAATSSAATSAAGAASGAVPAGAGGGSKKDVLGLIKQLKQNVRNGALCRDAVLCLHTRIFDDPTGSKENFTRFVLNANGGIASLLATIENHSSDPSYLELALVFLCNLMHYGGRRCTRVVSKVVKKGGSRICLNVLNKNSANMRVVHPATMAVIALATSDSKILVTARLNGALGTLLGLVKQHASLPRDGLASVLSCLCSLARSEGNLTQLGKKGAVVTLLEVTARHLRAPNSAVLRWVVKALVQLCALDDNAREAAKEGAVTLALHALYGQAGSVEVQKTVLDLMRILLKFPDGQTNFTAAGGYEYVVNLLLENNVDKQDVALLDLVVQLYKFFGVVDLPIGNDNDLVWTAPEAAPDASEVTPVETGDECSAAGDTASESAAGTGGGAPDWNGAAFSPELNDFCIDDATALPDALTVHHVKPFRDPRPSPSCPSSVDFVPPVEELLVQTPSQRTSIIRHEFQRLVRPASVINRVVYDDLPRNTTMPSSALQSMAAGQSAIPTLRFGSNFESGNLKRAIQVFDTEYDLILSYDVNTSSYCQWFYFTVENMRSDVTYKFNIINMEKPGSTFDDGQRPLFFSERRFTWSGLGWLRSGHNIAYLRNSYKRKVTKRKKSGEGGSSYYTLTFSVRFPHDDDRVYIANSYPFTYSDLITHIRRKQAECRERGNCDFVAQSLCLSQSGNPMPVVTITASSKNGVLCTADEIRKRQVVAVSARVHPGETGASYCAKGLIDYLLDSNPQAQWARENMVWKIVPMLNPDGVINGNHRCALGGKDLNREFVRTSPVHSPTIFYLKELIRHIKFTEGRSVMLYGDFHGHSRRENFFVYSCGASKKLEVHGLVVEKVFPRLLGELVPYFTYPGSSFKVQKSKETTGRVVFYRQLGIRMSYTLEGSMMGGDCCDFLPVAYDEAAEEAARVCGTQRKTHAHFNTGHYTTMGAMFAKAAALVCNALTTGEGRAADLVYEMLSEVSGGGPAAAAGARSGAAASAAGKSLGSSTSKPSLPGSPLQPVGDVAGGLPGSTSPAAAGEFDGGVADSTTPPAAAAASTMTGAYASNRRGSIRAIAKGAALRRVNATVTAADVHDVLATMLKGLPLKGGAGGTKAGRGGQRESAGGAAADSGGSGDEDVADENEDEDEDDASGAESSGESSVEDEGGDAGGGSEDDV